MTVNKLRPTKRASTVIGAVIAATISGYVVLSTGEKVPPAVALAVELTEPWEATKTDAYWDAAGGVWTVCTGETKGVKRGDHYTVDQCRAMFVKRAWNDFWKPIVRCAPPLDHAPVGVQWAMLDGAYNFGVGAWCGSTAARKIKAGDFSGACVAQTAWNKAGGRVLTGLVNRREMGDAARIGEAEACVTSIAMGSKP